MIQGGHRLSFVIKAVRLRIIARAGEATTSFPSCWDRNAQNTFAFILHHCAPLASMFHPYRPRRFTQVPMDSMSCSVDGIKSDRHSSWDSSAGDRQELSQNRDLSRIQSPLNRWVGTGRPGLRQFNAVVATTSEFRFAKCSSTFLNVASRVSGGMAILALTTSSAKRVRSSEASDS